MAEVGASDNVTVLVATPSPDLTYSQTRVSHSRLWVPKGSQRWDLCGWRSEYSRTNAMEYFLQETKHDYLLLLDSDMDPPEHALAELLEHRKEMGTGLYFYREPPAHPVIRKNYKTLKLKNWPPKPFFDFPEDALFKVGTTGFGFLLVHRSVFHKMFPLMSAMAMVLGQRGRALPWAYYGPYRGVVSGADLVFCDVAKLAGIDIWCDSSIFIPHIAPNAVPLEEYDAEKAKEARPDG